MSSASSRADQEGEGGRGVRGWVCLCVGMERGVVATGSPNCSLKRPI